MLQVEPAEGGPVVSDGDRENREVGGGGSPL